MGVHRNYARCYTRDYIQKSTRDRLDVETQKVVLGSKWLNCLLTLSLTLMTKSGSYEQSNVRLPPGMETSHQMFNFQGVVTYKSHVEAFVTGIKIELSNQGTFLRADQGEL